MKLLHIDSSMLGEDSVTRKVTKTAVERLRAQKPGSEVVYRDLAATPLEHATLADLGGDPALEEFLAADAVVIGAPMYNFTIPSALKAWLDRILVAGRTFRYGENGVEGLAGGKRVIVAVSRGGFYGPGAPAAAMEHVESYLRGAFGFIGIGDVEFIVAEGVKVSPEQREQAIRGALETAQALRAA
jgi:FMN-dependent NADH-azoreductase